MDASSAMANDTIYQIQQQLNVLKKSTQECGIEIEKTRQMQEHHSINFYKHHQISGNYGCSMFQYVKDSRDVFLKQNTLMVDLECKIVENR